MNEWSMTLDGRKLTPEEIDTIHFALVNLRTELAAGNMSRNANIETVRELIHEMTFGK